jgi:hypothetical protein
MKITDSTLESLCQISRTLTKLSIKSCARLSMYGLVKLVKQLPKLRYLDVQINTQIDNYLLDQLLITHRSTLSESDTDADVDADANDNSHQHRNDQILVKCQDTRVNTVEFVYKHPSTVRTLIDYKLYRFEYRNLTFECTALLSNPLINSVESSECADWNEDGLVAGVYGANNYDTEAYYGDLDFNGDDHYYDDDNDDGGDLDYLDENENEMLNEMT